MVDIDRNIKILKNIPLIIENDETVNQLVKDNLKSMGILEMTLYPGQRIMRTVPNFLPNSFTEISQISYKPAKLNTEYQRASLPFNTVFYGTFLPTEYHKGIIYDYRLTGCLEAVKLIRKDLDGEEKVTFTSWVVTKPIYLSCVYFHEEYHTNNEYLNMLTSKYYKSLKLYSKNIRADVLLSKFYSNQFAKHVKNHLEYMITSHYSTEILLRGFHGVAYPSVRMDGSGLNLAIHPMIANMCLEPEHIVECVVYKKGKEVVIDNEKMAIILKGEQQFKMTNILPVYSSGKEKIKQLFDV